MKTSNRFGWTALATASALGAIMVAGIAFSDDMAGMDMSGSNMGAMNHTMAPGGMGSHMARMENHMRMTELRPAMPQDEVRAHQIVETLRSSIAKYRDYHVALAHGMRIFLPAIPQDVYHFTDYAETGNEYQGRFDISHPGSHPLHARCRRQLHAGRRDVQCAARRDDGRPRSDRAAEHSQMARAHGHLPTQ